MRLIRSAALVTAALAAATMGFGVQAAQASSNTGWVYTTDKGGAVYFDADLNGYPSVEKITVCDNKSDGRGIEAEVTGYDGGGHHTYILDDPSNDGHCASYSANLFLEETDVEVVVYEYAGPNIYNLASTSALA